MMQETVRGNLVHHPAGPDTPLTQTYRAEHATFRLSHLPKAGKRMWAHKQAGGLLQQRQIQLITHGPAPAPLERRPGFRLRADPVEIAARYSRIARMEVQRHL